MYSEIHILFHIYAWWTIEPVMLEFQHPHCESTPYPESREILELSIRKTYLCVHGRANKTHVDF